MSELDSLAPHRQTRTAHAAWADIVEEEGRLTGLEEAYLGRYDSIEAYVEQLIDDLGYDQLLNEVVPENLRPYVHIDVQALARDMRLSGDIHAIDDGQEGIWVFDGRC